MTNVLFISYNGALESVSQSQVIPYLSGLSRKGIRLILLSFEKKDNLKDREALDKLKTELVSSGIEWHRLKYHKKPPLFSSIYDIIIGTIYCFCLILRKKIEFIHARSYVPATIAYILNRCFKTKFIFDMRGMMIDEYVDAEIIKRDGIIYKLTKILEKKILISAERIVVLTEKIKDVIEDFGFLRPKADLRIDVIPCCVDLHRFNYDLPRNMRSDLGLENKFVFLYTGSVGTWYFLEGMLDLFYIAKRNIPTAHFLFLNLGQKEFIRNIILQKNLDLNDFTIMGAPYDRISDYISECDVGIIFYKQTFSRLACCPIKFAEYLACGIPVIISLGVGDTAEIVEKEKIGIVIDGFSNSAYSRAITHLKQLLSEGQTLKKRCCAIAEKYFSLENGIQKYQRIYCSLIRSGVE